MYYRWPALIAYKALWQPPVGSYKYLVFVCILCVYIVLAYWK